MTLKLFAAAAALTLAAGGAFAAQPAYSDGSTAFSGGVASNQFTQSGMATERSMISGGQLTSPDANPRYHGPGSTWDYHGAVGGGAG